MDAHLFDFAWKLRVARDWPERIRTIAPEFRAADPADPNPPA
jgi:hypothetical protein